MYTQATNRRHNRTGHLFQGRYNTILVDKKSYLLELARYVVLNPLRAKGMVQNIEDWPWSNYLAMIDKANTFDWLTTDWILSQFGGSKEQAMRSYQQFVIEGVAQNIEIWSKLKGQIYLGDEGFVSDMQNKIEKNQNDWNIPKKQKRAVAESLSEIEQQAEDRDSAITTAYATGVYNQRKIPSILIYTLAQWALLYGVQPIRDSGPGSCALLIPAI